MPAEADTVCPLHWGGSGFEEGWCVPRRAILRTLHQDDQQQSLSTWTSESLQPCIPSFDVPYTSAPLHSETEHALQEVTHSDVCPLQRVTPGGAVTFTPALWLPKMRFVRGCTRASISWFFCIYTLTTQ